MNIPDDVIEEVVSALNVALTATMMSGPKEIHAAILKAAHRLDDAINDAAEAE